MLKKNSVQWRQNTFVHKTCKKKCIFLYIDIFFMHINNIVKLTIVSLERKGFHLKYIIYISDIYKKIPLFLTVFLIKIQITIK